MSKNFDYSLKIPNENKIANLIDYEEFDFEWCHVDYFFCRYWKCN